MLNVVVPQSEMSREEEENFQETALWLAGKIEGIRPPN
jgi:hypothetical protein